MDSRPTSPPLRDLFSERPSVRDLYELLRLPVLFGVATAVVTWLIWYYTSTPCTPEVATLNGCNPAIIARYINVDIYGRMLTYSAILAGVGGVWNYDMFTKMRAAIAAERSRADEAEKQLAEYRLQAEEERRLRDEERRQEGESFMATLAEERRRSDENQQTFMATLAEERRRSDENQQAFMATLSEITVQVTRLVERQNSNGQDGH